MTVSTLQEIQAKLINVEIILMGDGTSTTAKTRDVVSGLKKQSSNHGKAFHQQTVSKNQKVHLRQLSRKTTSKFKQNVSTAPLTLYFIVVFLIHRSF